MPTERPIAVIIAAFNAQETIAKSVRSALDCPEVGEVVVVDDASSDRTAFMAGVAGAGDSRFKVLVQECNRGPSAARNRAIRESNSPIIAMLDADDLFLPGRFGPLLVTDDWDLIADNIVFFSNYREIVPFQTTKSQGPHPVCTLSFEDFVLANVPKRDVRRGELGFLKPLIRRSFLTRHQLSYPEDCRLGEDFILYTEALSRDGRFKLVLSGGYAGLIRPNSLSAQHQAEDLRALLRQERRLLENLNLTSQQKAALSVHARSTQRRLRYREVLQKRQRKGMLSGGFAALKQPTSILDWWYDYSSPAQPAAFSTPRMLLSPQDFERYAQ
ncbi:glycosyltransferase family 2 protein [Blastomonas aquatica]|uniref:Glycosyl transferase family A n=1 Tax=Blastomonas aquatica TaxID=1510276 RepID=A0ABQ1JRE9_9SPHN|nr:glycosyltransferase family 2 protein [Blastomonas aquatica]GGB75676.1 glycosyl transferase family A [Blastomonas aquatica]